MSEMLENGFEIKTMLNGTVKVLSFIGEGGQGEVYLVDYRGEKKALKWYKKSSLLKPSAFYENIKRNVMSSAPSPEFLWPQDITEWYDGSFGYVMDLRPDGYYEITEYILCNVRFKSYKAIIDAALSIVQAFRILHNAGFSYQDLNDGNFFINPQNGKVLICDNDNVAPDGVEAGIMGKPRYMAPEIVLKKSKPNSLTDRFSMALIIYRLFCLDHPLEGKRYLVPCLTDSINQKIYGSEPIFMMDPDDDRNRPHPVLHRNSISVWQCLPDYVQKIFLTAFSKKSFEKPSARPKEIDWLKVLTRFRSEIVSCQCGNEIFTQQGEPCKCESCGRMANVRFKLQLAEYSIPAIRDSRIYRCQLGVCNEEDALKAVAQVVEKKETGDLGVRNKSDSRWDAITTKGTSRKVAPDEVVPLKDGIKLTIKDADIIIKSN